MIGCDNSVCIHTHGTCTCKVPGPPSDVETSRGRELACNSLNDLSGRCSGRRTFALALGTAHGSPRPFDLASAMDDDGATAAEFLWEQIAGSLDPVELHEVEKVVGASAVRESEDVYAEVRALREILSECAADTEAALATRGALGPPAVGLLQLELSQLVGQLRERAAAAGAPEDALLPPAASEARQALDSVLGTGSRPGSTSSGRLSLRDMRGGSDGGSRPSTASRPGSRLSDVEHWGGGGGGDSPFSRPQTARSAGSRPQTAASQLSSRETASRPHTPGSDGGGGGGDGGSVVAEAVQGGRRSRGGTVIAQLRAALDEEREELLAQAEQLRLSIDDEHESAAEFARPPPGLAQLHELKRALQRSVAHSDHAAHLHRQLPRDRDRRALSRYAPLPGAGGGAAEGGGAAGGAAEGGAGGAGAARASSRLRRLVQEHADVG